MNKTTLILLVLVSSAFLLSTQLGHEGFMDDDGSGNKWNYQSNIPYYNLSNDIWQKDFSGANGRISGAHSGNTYIAGRDLDNPHSESVLGTSNPEHIITFDTYNLSGVDAEISFWYNYVNLDKNDYIRFELSYNNNTTWNTSDVDYSFNIFSTNQGGNYSSNDWEEFNYNVPSGNNYVRARLVVYQNGNEYLGFDSFELKPSTLSSNKNIIKGFTFSPNPTTGRVSLKAESILDRVEIYDILSKKVLVKQGGSMNMEVNILGVKPGLYFAKIFSGNQQQTVKLIKK